MSTRDPRLPPEAASAEQQWNDAARMIGVAAPFFDPSVLAKMASDYYAAVPGAETMPTSAPMISVPGAAIAPTISAAAMPTQPPGVAYDPRWIDPLGLDPGVASMASVPGVPSVPGMPGGLGGHGMPSFSDPNYYFLEGARAMGAIYAPVAAPITPEVTTGISPYAQPFEVERVRRDFPILEQRIHGRPLIWLDNAATTQKPQVVIDRISRYYEEENSNIHRGAHELAARATDAYEAAREKVRRFMRAPSTKEIVFARGATEAINLVAQSWGRAHVEEGDEIVVSWLEHHSNIVPWQLLCSETGARLRVVPIDDRGQVILAEYERLLGPRTKLVSLAHVSNALGTVLPVKEMTDIAHRHGAKVLIDGAQAVSHFQIDVGALDCDFYAFSGHKVYAPTGIGVLYGKADALESMPPWQGGGNMITDVTFEQTRYHQPPFRFEAGTGNIADAIGLGAALDYLEGLGMANVARHEQGLLEYATRKLQEIPGLKMIGTAHEKAGVMSFVLDGFRTEEVGTALDAYGIAVRSGHHCAQPALRRYGLESSVRPSLGVYNNCADIDALIDALRKLRGSR